MNGHIVLRSADDLRAFALGKGTTVIGSGETADLMIANPGIEASHATLTWEPRASTWILSPTSPTAARQLRLNGRACANAVSLTDGDIIELPDVVIRFGVTPALPRFQDQDVREIPLRSLRQLVLGRAGADASAGPKVNLDPDDARISRTHLELEQPSRGEVWATDKSQTGTMLNGQRFDRKQLIVGDRLRLGGYNFEFTGSSLRLVATYGGAKVEARNVSVQLKSGRKILAEVSLDIAPCSFAGILGGSGSGKSTLMNALCGVNPGTSGEVYINGARLGDPREMAAAGIGYVPQDDIVHRELTVTQAITYSARLKLPSSTPRRAIRDLVDETIGRLGLAEHKDKHITQLSGGQRKRVSIAAELLAKPGVLFLDEPSSGLDPKTEYDLMSMLRRLASTDCTVVCTTHVLGRAYLFDQLIFIHSGQLIFNGTPDAALAWFKVEHGLEEIYLKIGADETKTATDWRLEFETSRTSATPLAYLPSADETAAPPLRRRGPGYLAQFAILLRRQWSILKADLLNLMFLLAQPVSIGLLVGWVADDAVLRMFLCVVATLWFGCSNGAQQIVREIAVFRRERVCGLGLNGYLQSKYAFLTLVTGLQAVLLLIVTLATAHALNPGALHKKIREVREKEAAAKAEGRRPAEFEMTDFYHVMEQRLTAPPPEAALAAAADAAARAKAVVDEFETVTVETKDRQPTTPAAAAAEPPPPPQEKKPGMITKLMLRAAMFFEFAQSVLDSTDPGERTGPLPDSSRKLYSIGFIAFALKIGALLAAASVGVAIGLAISALVRSETQAVMWVPLVLIPQILFGGFVVTRPEMSASVRAASALIPSFCAERIMDVAGLYGQTTPRISNRTKYPVFLTPTLEQDEIKWTAGDEEQSEKYDKVSEWNKSWQNLLVSPTLVGKRKIVSQFVRGVEKIDESVERRDDVRYALNTIYRYINPALESLMILGAWIIVCYGVTIAGLIGKQKGK